jgi:hypothetical protein
MKIGFITDLHYRHAVPGTSPIAKRECRRVGELLDRCLAALAAAGVDLLICAGDCVDDPEHPLAIEDLASLRDRFAASGLPAIVIPGNHDPAPEVFYRILPQPPRRWRIGPCEIVTFFDDVCEPGSEQSRRSAELLRFMRDALSDCPADVALTVLVQHYVIYPEYSGAGYPHNYANDAEIRAILEGSPRSLLALSGHCHAGHPLTRHNGVAYFTGRALCERPYPYYVIEIVAGDAPRGHQARVHELTVPVSD